MVSDLSVRDYYDMSKRKIVGTLLSLSVTKVKKIKMFWIEYMDVLLLVLTPARDQQYKP